MTTDIVNKEYKTVTFEEAQRLILTDSKGNRYRIKEDAFGALEIMALDGRLSIEPNTSNLIALKTI